MNFNKKFKSIIFLLFFCILLQVNSFNLSPQPNYIFKEPKLHDVNLPKIESSYFGYSLILRKNCLMVGAPRAQSNLDSQRNNNQTGAIYKCDFLKNVCKPFYMDKLGNVEKEKTDQLKSLIKDKQWLGAVMMDGTSSFVVCAPNIVTNDLPKYFGLNGICYRTLITNNSQPSNVQTLTSLRNINFQIKQKEFIYMFGQEGFSLHVTDYTEEIIVGAPGISEWRGSVLRYKSNDDPNQRKILYNVSLPLPNENVKKNKFNYFGYAVTSGYFYGNKSTKLLYVASSPRGLNLFGEVIIFDFIVDSTKTLKKFEGKQMGEYFGYSLITDDFNGDGLTDLAVSAPLYSMGNSNFDNGKVYVYINKKDLSFEKQVSLTSTYLTNGRFGTTMGKIGDINQDGYNDLAIAAPFEENGAVYIFLGSSSGLSTKPSQRIIPPNSDSINKIEMFGMGLSKGVDIDNNYFNDLAIGSPNSDLVYVYKSYPVVDIFVTIHSTSTEIGINTTEFVVRYCWKYNTDKEKNYNIQLNLTIKLDSQVGRAKFLNTKKNIQELVVNASLNYQCNSYNVSVEYSFTDVLKPITLDLSYDLITKNLNNSNFCDNCIILNPNIQKFTQNSVIITSGCKNTTCSSDLKINSTLVDTKLPYILGSTRSISIIYNIFNFGETSYMTQVKIIVSETISFYKIPSYCKYENFGLTCYIGKGVPLYKDQKEQLLIAFDASKLNGKLLKIQANISSSGEELNSRDNTVVNIIPLMEFSEIEIYGKSSLQSMSLEEVDLKIQNITNQFEIRNFGPTIVKELSVVISIPIVFVVPKLKTESYLIDYEDIIAKVKFNNRELDIEWLKNYKINTTKQLEAIENDLVKNNLDDLEISHSLRTKRFADNKKNTKYNYNVTRRNISNQYDLMYESLPEDRTITFNCDNENKHNCVNGTVNIQNFQPSDIPIIIEITYFINLSKIDLLFTKKRDIFVIMTSAKIFKLGDEDGHTINVTNYNPYSIFTKQLKISTPIWVYALSSFVGFILFSLMSCGLHKLGFFRRKKKEHIKRHKRELRRRSNQGYSTVEE